MNSLSVFAISTLLLAGATASCGGQEAKDLVGSWAHVSNINTSADGKKSNLYGEKPSGQAMFGADGRFSIFFHNPDMPKIAANNRTQGTAEENKAIVSGMVALYGSYTVVNKEIIMKVEGSSYPNWVGTEQRRPISSFTQDEMHQINMGFFLNSPPRPRGLCVPK
jgi:hypothetical protein